MAVFDALGRYCIRLAQWCWRHRPQLAGLAALFMSSWAVFLAWRARITLAVSIDSGSRGGAGEDQVTAAMMLGIVAILSLLARACPPGPRWPLRIARASLIIATIWLVYTVNP